MEIQKSNENHIIRIYNYIRTECRTDAPDVKQVVFASVRVPSLHRSLAFSYILIVPMAWFFSAAGSAASLTKMIMQIPKTE